jgi:hypothetical protein
MFGGGRDKIPLIRRGGAFVTYCISDICIPVGRQAFFEFLREMMKITSFKASLIIRAAWFSICITG